MTTIESGQVMVNGKPFIPVGFFSDQRRERLAEFADLGCNCAVFGPASRLSPWQIDAYLNEARCYGIGVIFSLTDFAWDDPRVGRLVTLFREHPALLAWFINDERPADKALQLRQMASAIRTIDKHPLFYACYSTGDISSFAGSFDAIGTSIYPVPRDPVMAVGERVVAARRYTTVPQWTCIQACAYPGRAGARPPTPAELRLMTENALLNGASGILWWCRYRITNDEWTRLKPTFAELVNEIRI